MSASDFRQITVKGDAPKGERLFRAAVSAFCSLTRPSRREIAQLEDLTLPLFDCVSVESRRYVAAALSECPYPPAALIKRLADEAVDVAAPLLIRSSALSDIDLIALIGRHGHGHARAIARRPNLNPTIAELIAILERKASGASPAPRDASRAARSIVPADFREEPRSDDRARRPSFGEAAESARRRLRSMMLPAEAAEGTKVNPIVGSFVYARLRDTALTGHLAFFHTAVADALAVEFATVRRIAATSSYTWLLAAFRALELNDEQAFVLAAAVCPSEFSGPDSIRLFLSRYRLLGHDIALSRVRTWQAEAVAAAADTSEPPASSPVQDDARPAPEFVSGPWIRAQA